MNVLKSLIIAIVLTFLAPLQAQKAEEIITTYLENTGGKANWEKVSSIKMATSITFNGFEIPLTMYSTSNGKQAMIIQPFGNDVTLFATDGKTAWNTNPMTMSVEKLSPEQAVKLQKATAIFPNPFLNYAANGYEASFGGKYKIKDTKVFKITLKTTPDQASQDTTDFYFDSTTYLPIQIEKTVHDKLHIITIEKHITVDGITFPSEFTKDGEVIKISTLIINPNISESLFQFPK